MVAPFFIMCRHTALWRTPRGRWQPNGRLSHLLPVHFSMSNQAVVPFRQRLPTQGRYRLLTTEKNYQWHSAKSGNSQRSSIISRHCNLGLLRIYHRHPIEYNTTQNQASIISLSVVARVCCDNMVHFWKDDHFFMVIWSVD